MIHNFLKISLIVTSLAGSIVHAEAIPEVLVTAKGNQTMSDALHSAHVFTKADIEAAQIKDITALLDRLTGISVRDSGGRGSATGVFLRGVSSSQTIVLIDGVRVGSATLGAAALNSYPVEAIERIEVLKGPFSGIYGADGVGGVIQLFTKKGGDGTSSVSAAVGSDSLNEVSVALNGGNERNSFHLGATQEETKGIDRTSILTDGNDDDDAFEETAISFGGKVSFGENITANLSVLYTDSEVDFDNTFGADPGLRTDSKALSSALNIATQVSDNLTWTTTLGINSDESITNGEFPSDITTNRDSLSTELAFVINDATLLTGGVDYYQEDIDSLTEYPISDRDNSGAYAQLKTSVGAFGLVGSLRYDDNSTYGTNTNGSLALSYDLSDDIRAIASYGTAFVAPSFNFLYFPFFGNPDILPEESESAELSLLGNMDTFTWRISAYQTDIENLFSFNPVTFLAANVGEAEIKGLELEVKTQVLSWDLGLNLDLLSAEDKITGVELDDRAERTLQLTVARSFNKLDLRFDAKAESGRFDNRGTELSSYTLFDISGQYHLSESMSILANIDNIFDKDHTVNLIGATERYNTEGTQAKLTFKYKF